MRPPKKSIAFLRWFCREDYIEEIEGDLTEIFTKECEDSQRKAKLKFALRVIKYFRPEFIRPLRKYQPDYMSMHKSYFKIAWRSLIRTKGYSIINIGGLAVGMTVAMLIGLWVHDELTFDKYHQNHDRIAQVLQHLVINHKTETESSTPVLMAQELRASYGNDFKYAVQASWSAPHMLTVGNNHIVKDGVFFEPDAPEMLGLRMLKGSRAGLEDPRSIMLSASAAKSMFGAEDPVNKTIGFDKLWEVKITGVYEDLPDNSSFKDVQIMMPWELFLLENPQVGQMEKPWESNFARTFVQIADHADMEEVSAKIRDIKLRHITEEEKKYQWVVFLQPMRRWHLYNEFKDGINTGGNIQYVKLFGLIGIFVLLLACINFMNLATAKSEKRAKEVGIRKTVGSVRAQLLSRFFAESYVVVLLAFALALTLVFVLLPWFNEVADKQIAVPWLSPVFWSVSFAFIFITGLLAGSYPALYMSSFQPLQVLKGTFRVGKSVSVPRKVLVVTQFTVSVALIIGTIVVHQQIQHAKNRPVGYDMNGLVNLSFQMSGHFDAVRTDLKTAGVIEEMAATQSPLTAVWNTSGNFDWEGKDPNLTIEFLHSAVTHEFGETVQWKVKEGRDFSREFATDSLSLVINESAARSLNFKEPVGKTIKWGDRTFTIVGIVENILQESPFAPVRPTIYYVSSHDSPNLLNLVVKLNPEQSAVEAIAKLESVWKKYVHDAPFGYTFVDETYGSKFRMEERIARLSSCFAVLAIFISCLGLFGMASFVAEQRTKEIGIRKVLGASAVNLWGLLSKEFVLLVILSCVIAIPIAWYYLDHWLTGYDYRIQIGWQVFVLSASGAMVITLATVSFQTIRAAFANPVNSLRSE